MDFPKSVPGVGLVGGQFAGENAALGRRGSLIPSAWGNAVTLELLSVIEAAGLAPDEAQTNQLLEAIRTLVPERSAFARVSGTLALPVTAFGIYALADGGAAATVTLPSIADLVDDTELLLFASHANTAAVQVKAAAGQTVQGPAALMAGSTTAFMLPTGGDWVRLRSEKAQGRWVVVSSYANARVDALGAQVSSLDARKKALGDGQAFADYTSQRLVDTTYTNTMGRQIKVRLTVTGTSDIRVVATVGGRAPIGNGSAGVTGTDYATIEFTVEPGETYRVHDVIGTLNWQELR